MQKSKKRFAILCHEHFNYIKNKTGNMLIRYRSDEVIGVIDREKVGSTSEKEVGVGGNTPVFNDFNALKHLNPDTLVVGNATQGGFISDDYREEIKNAIQSGCDIISGMHQFLNDDDELKNLADQNNVKLIDLRRPPDPPNFPSGTWKNRKVPVLLIVGTDCDTGKMTTAWELTTRLRSRNRKVEFIGTGQTGILLSGSGVPIDAVKADFMAGEIEYLIQSMPQDTELIIVEGQGALTNQFYAGVTLGLMHGAMPDYMLMTHDPARDLDVTDYPMTSMRHVMNLHTDLMKSFKDSTFIGINLLTFALDDETARKAIEDSESEYNIPATDLLRFGERGLIDSIDKLI
ncbi:MAG: hypothetical protein CMG35_01805 [Candidatus Marinimicrobia bacterium]|nr:hypothetical protein [Candidatus Neomarinimicrobiota bacterium]|tara:strand:+ start:2188 stop:3225 length:1038 start_codon:yes stop_codon:yes gene_type:complete